MPDLPEEVSHLADQFGNFSRLLPTRDIKDFDEALTSLGISLGKSDTELGNIDQSLKGLRNSSNLAKGDFVSMADSFYRSAGRATLSLKDFQNIASQVSKVDPFHAAERTRELERYGPLLTGLTGNLKNNRDAYRLLTIAESEHNYGAAATIRAMINGEKASDSYAFSIKKLGNVYKDVSLDAANFISQSTTLKSTFNFLTSDMGAGLVKVGAAFLAATVARRGFFALTGFGGGHGGLPIPTPGTPPTPLPRWRTNLARGGKYGAIAGGAIALGAVVASNDSNRSSVVGGAITGAGIGAIAGPEGAAIGAGLGAIVGWFNRMPDASNKAAEAAKHVTLSFTEMADQAGRRIESLNKLFSGDSPEGVNRSMIQARTEIAQTAASMGLVGPQIIAKLAEESIDSLRKQYEVMKSDKAAFIADMVGKGSSLVVANQKYGIELIGIQNRILQAAGTVRRSIIEQFTGASINAPSGSYSMPGGLSDRQKYGGSYQDFMPLVNIGSRPQQMKYGDLAQKFAPLQKQIANEISSHAGGGLIPGAPSSSDNRLSAVASGEYIVNSSAVSHYGPALFDALNRKSAPHFADGGFAGFGSSITSGLKAAANWATLGGAGAVYHTGQQVGENYYNEKHKNDFVSPDETTGDYIAKIVALGGKKFQSMPAKQIAAYAKNIQIQDEVNRKRYTTDAEGEHRIPSTIAESMTPGGDAKARAEAAVRVAAKEAEWAKTSKSEKELSAAGVAGIDNKGHLNPYTMPNWASLRDPTGRGGSRSWHPNFGKSAFGDVVLGGHGVSKHHRDYFSEDVFNGGGHMGAGGGGVRHPAAHRNSSNTPELKKLDEIKGAVIQLGGKIEAMGRGFSSAVANT
jgi:hypothetical protein